MRENLNNKNHATRKQLLIKTVASPRRHKALERLNHCEILSIEVNDGFEIGDKVEYINALWEKALGFVAYFCKDHRNGDRILMVVMPEDGFGFSTHHGGGKPLLLEGGGQKQLEASSNGSWR